MNTVKNISAILFLVLVVLMILDHVERRKMRKNPTPPAA
jgi:hypothetical protein